MAQFMTTLDIKVLLNSELWAAIHATADLPERVKNSAADTIRLFMNELGVPGSPQVLLDELPTGDPNDMQLLQLSVDGELCHYPKTILHTATSYCQDRPIYEGIDLPAIRSWLQRDEPGRDIGAVSDRLVIWISLVCRGILLSDPAVLIGSLQAEAYQASLPAPVDKNGSLLRASEVEPDALLLVLKRVLRHRLSIANKQIVANTMSESRAKNLSSLDTVEELICALSPNVVEIHLPYQTLHDLTSLKNQAAHEIFGLARKGLFNELGMLYPDYRFIPDDELRPNSFAIRINHLKGMPIIGLSKDTVLANETTARLASLQLIQADAGKSALNPVSGQDGCVVDTNNRWRVEQAGIIVWDAMDYLSLALLRELRQSSADMLTSIWVEEQLREVDWSYPALLKILRNKFSNYQVTRALRSLLEEGLSIRNLRTILERLIDYDYIVADINQVIIFDERLPADQPPNPAWINDPDNLVAFLRMGLQRQITYKYTKGRNTMAVYVVDPEIERLISQNQIFGENKTSRVRISETQRDQIVRVVRKASEPVESGERLVILTTSIIRPALQEIVRVEIPTVALVSYSELSPDADLQVIGKIYLEE